MNGFVNTIAGVFDQLDPFNIGNLILYFAWVAIFSFTIVGLWRSHRRWVRLLCYMVNQVCSIGILVSLTITVLLAYTYWWQSLTAAAVSIALAWRCFSGEPPAHRQIPQPSDNEARPHA